MTFENISGLRKGQASALKVGSDRSTSYRCSIKGYQDTLYAHPQCQFYYCDIYGTIDFRFGNSAAVFQSCNILVRKLGQQNVITAQGRTDANQKTNFSIQNCKVSAASDLLLVKKSILTYFGRS
eukprot:Gb_40543 [translate_table: standard]